MTKTKHPKEFKPLLAFLARVPAIRPAVGSGRLDDGNWWIKFAIDIGHPLAWHVVQELGHVLNYLSTAERLPTVFEPVSPPLSERRPAAVPLVGHRVRGFRICPRHDRRVA